MLGIFDFKDALRMLFKMKNACRDRTLEDYRGKRFGIDFRFLNYFILVLKNWSDTAECMGLFKKKLAFFDIDFTVIFKGVEFFGLENLILPFYYIQWTREKYFFFNLIYQYLACTDAEHKLMLKQILSVRFLGREDTFVLYSHYLNYRNYFRRAMEVNDVSFMRAPQFIDNQLLYLLNNKEVDYIKASPFAFIIGDLNSIIAEMDVDSAKVVTYEWDMFVDSFQIESKLLKKCLLGSMMYFLCHTSVKGDNKFCKSILERIEDFPKRFHELAAENMKLVIRHIEYLKTKIDPDAPIDETFCRRIATMFHLDEVKVLNFCSLILNCPVMTTKNEITRFPQNSQLNHIRLSINMKHPDVLFLFCRKYMDEELFALMNDCLNHKAVINNPKFDFVEFKFVYKSYFKDKLEQAISKIVSVLPEEKNNQFKFRFFTEDIINIKLQPVADIVACPYIPEHVPINPFTVLYGFYESLTKKKPLLDFTHGQRPPLNKILACIRLSLLNTLGYCSLDTTAILIPGAGLLESGAHQYTEEIIMIFELVRNSLMKPDFFIDEKPLLMNYQDLINDNIFDSLITTSEDADDFLNEFSIHDKSINDSLTHIKNSKQINNELRKLDRPSSSELKKSLTKCLNMYYKVIKDFQKDFLRYHEPQTLFINTNDILSAAFHNSALVRVQIISRIFTFACVEYVIDEFYDIDSTRYESIINVIRKGLNAVTISSLILFVRKLGLEKNFDMMGEACRASLFRKNYSTSAGTLIKILLTKYLIYKVLVQRQEEFAVVYKKISRSNT